MIYNYFAQYSFLCSSLNKTQNGDGSVRRGPREVTVLCDMYSLMPVGLFMFLSMGAFLPGCLFAVVVVKCFMIGVNV